MITYQMVCRCCLFFFLFCLFLFFFFHNGSVTHIFAHTCTRTQTDFCDRPQTRHTRAGLWNAARPSARPQLSGLNILLQDCGLGPAESWLACIGLLLYPCLPSPNPLSALPTPSTPKKQGRSGKWQNVSAEREVWHPPSFCSQLLFSNDALLKCQTN